MSKRRFFHSNYSCSDLNLNLSEEMTPNRGGIHPALMSTVSRAPGTVKSSKRKSDVHPTEPAKKSKPDSQGSAEDSDSDPLEVPGFFYDTVHKLPYTKEEDEMILKYVLKGQNIFRVGSILLWKHLESKKDNPRRTHHSLKNRFLRNIKPYLFTTFGHLTKDKTVTERILCKFPELKQSLGRREILSNIRLPERKPPPKPTEEDAVSSTSTNYYKGNECRISPVRSPKPDDISISEIHSRRTEPEPNEAKAVTSDSFKSVVYERIIKTNGNDITVSVNFKSKKYIEMPSLGIYKTFEKLKRKNRFGFCPTCGRYSNPKRGSAFKYNKEASIIPNSLDTPEASSKSSKKDIFRSKTKKNSTPKKRRSSESHGQSPCSPSLLSDAGEGRKIDNSSPEEPRDNSKAAACSSRRDAISESHNKAATCSPRKDVTSASDNKASQIPSSVTPAEKPVSRENRNEMLRLATANSRSAKEANSMTANQRRDSDEDVESICEDTVTNFRKLIDYEEEKELVRRCLNKNFKTIGLEDVSQANWDSYFLESSSDVDTPPLTIDFERDTQASAKEGQTASTSGSTPSKNTKKGSDKTKKS